MWGWGVAVLKTQSVLQAADCRHVTQGAVLHTTHTCAMPAAVTTHTPAPNCTHITCNHHINLCVYVCMCVQVH